MGVVLPPDVVPVGTLLPVLADVAELVELLEEAAVPFVLTEGVVLLVGVLPVPGWNPPVGVLTEPCPLGYSTGYVLLLLSTGVDSMLVELLFDAIAWF